MVLEGSAGFAGFCEAMGSFESFERLWEALRGFIGFGRPCHALEGLWLWKALGTF